MTELLPGDFDCPVCLEAFPGEPALDRHLSVDHSEEFEAAVQAREATAAKAKADRQETKRLGRDSAYAERLRRVASEPEPSRESDPEATRSGPLQAADLLRRTTACQT